MRCYSSAEKQMIYKLAPFDPPPAALHPPPSNRPQPPQKKPNKRYRIENKIKYGVGEIKIKEWKKKIVICTAVKMK